MDKPPRMIKIPFLAGIVAIALIACKKDEPMSSGTNNMQNNNNTTISPSVYIAGDSFTTTTQYLPYPIYWKNGKQVHLPHAGHSSGIDIAVSDSNVYIASSGIYFGNDVTYWKNTTGINLADPTIIYPSATGITLSGNDVYTVGSAEINNFEKKVPIYWKNQDKAIKLSTFASSDGEGRDITVVGNDVYIAGTTFDFIRGAGSPACYWKNGIPTFLHAISPSFSGVANSIFVSGSDIHVVGKCYPTYLTSPVGWAVYWKNGVPTELAPSDKISEANCVTVVGNDVYIAGAVTAADGQRHAAYWKNGVQVILNNTPTTISSTATAIAVYENDIYVTENRSVDSAYYWKNGQAVKLGRGRAYAIVVKK